MMHMVEKLCNIIMENYIVYYVFQHQLEKL
jgi:hypothetical protein